MAGGLPRWVMGPPVRGGRRFGPTLRRGWGRLWSRGLTVRLLALLILLVAPAPALAQPAPDEPAADEDDDTGGLQGHIDARYRLRMNFQSDIPLDPIPGEDPGETADLDQNYWGQQWLRIAGELRLDEPDLRLFGEADLLWGVAFGELAVGQAPAAFPRDEYAYPGIRLRQLVLTWGTPVAQLRVGQVAFDWGLGILSNGGDRDAVFGDPRFGDLVRRVELTVRPGGPGSAMNFAIAADWIAWDLLADFENRDEVAFRGLAMAWLDLGESRVGAYVAYRRQENGLDDVLERFVLDAYAKVGAPDPSGRGRIEAAAEVAYLDGRTTYFRTADQPEREIEQLLAAVQLARRGPTWDLVLEGGYASGDANPSDGVERRGTFDPDHRVGLVLFPEVLAAQTARSAFFAQQPGLVGRPLRGAELGPTNGGVAGAFYFFPYGIWRPHPVFEARLGAVLAWASAPVVDPFRQRVRSEVANFRGGSPNRRDLGLELDAALLLHGPVSRRVEVSGGVEGGLLIPGRAFEDLAMTVPGPIGVLRLRLGLRY